MYRRSARLLSSSRSVLEKEKLLYSKTLHLPKTSFGPKIPSRDDRQQLVKTSSQDLYKWQSERENYSQEFTLHDGPPYANGDLHLGHSLNKIVKDIINRFELIYNNSKINYRPGWDCHGLPIEMKATSNKSVSKSNPKEIRAACRSLASSMIDRQREQFEEFGIMTDFHTPYITMSHNYEINQLRVFQKLMENGLLTRQMKPVWWGCETKTALAEAELEYNSEHKSVAIFVKFPIQTQNFYKTIRDKYNLPIKDGDLKFLIWTSTPWTIPANKAICVHKELVYTILRNSTTGENLVVADSLANEILKLDESFTKYESEIEILGSELIGLEYSNPASQSKETFPVLHGDHVSDTAGSGLVHTAPAHGAEDYLIGKKHGLDIYSSIDECGRFLESNIPDGFKSLHGEKVTEKTGLWKCINIISDSGMIYHINKSYKHSYPYDWRSQKPVVQRATPQWFINVEKIKETALQALEKVQFVPESGRNRLPLFIRNRNEWCISRQRVWGVPLPIIYNKQTGAPIVEMKTIEYIIDRIDEYGTDEWFEQEECIARWLPDHLKDNSNIYSKGTDTMDVWFDSGTSWTTLLNAENTQSDTPIADLYLEGSDQHRGWFQSSLLNRIISSGVEGKHFKPVAPFKKIITHGFTLDKNNDKMSKSKGNVIVPKQVLNGGGKPHLPTLGVDGLRLWVASSNYTSDVSVSTEILLRVFENVKKLRVTLKYMLGNLNDFDKPIDYSSLNPLDKYVLSRLYKLQANGVEHYKSHNFSRVVKEINSHVSTDLSAYYFDISKDCLYTDAADSHRRRSIQTVLQIILKTYIGLLAPIQPLLTQEVWDAYSGKFGIEEKSPFMVGEWNNFYQLPKSYLDENVEADFQKIWAVRENAYKLLEDLRIQGFFKNKLETQVNITVDGDSSIANLLKEHQKFLDDYFLVSKVKINESIEEYHSEKRNMFSIDGSNISIEVGPSQNFKCPRCWKFISEEVEELCTKCESVVHV